MHTVWKDVLTPLGLLHFVYTFWVPRLVPRDPALKIRMSEVSPVISRALSQLLFQSPFLPVVGLGMLVGLFTLAKACWFSVPFTCLGISLACYVASIVMSRV